MKKGHPVVSSEVRHDAALCSREYVYALIEVSQ